MAKTVEEHESKAKPEGHKEGKGKKHLHQIRTVRAESGSFVHHHTYKAKAGDHMHEPERMMATSLTPEEAGEHVTEQFGGQTGGGEEAEAGPQPAGEEAGEEEQPGE